MTTNYPAASEMTRSLSAITIPYTGLVESQGYRLVEFRPHWSGYAFWLVSPKGFMWEMFDSEAQGRAYLERGDFDA